MHKYYCHYCSIFLFGDTPQRLAEHVNEHNTRHHEFDTNSWTALGIVHSSYYVEPIYQAPAERALVRYNEPHGMTSQWEWGTAQRAPNITLEDRAMLKENGIKW